MKICYVVHRYPPYSGGSEYFIQGMAEESKRRGHDVTVFTGEHNGDLNGVRVTSDGSVFDKVANTPFDLIVVHGADVWLQNMVLSNIKALGVPVLYMIILPSESQAALVGLNDAQMIGCSTKFDWDHVRKHGAEKKSFLVRHALPNSPEHSIGNADHKLTRSRYGIDTKYMILSCGGYWPNKVMHELVNSFNKAGLDDTTLVLTGYANRDQAPKESEFVKVFMVEERQEALDLIAAADLYVMHSHQEGFGLVLLEAMLNKTPWIARHIAGAVELRQFGETYTTEDEFVKILQKRYADGFVTDDFTLELAKDIVLKHRLIGNTVDDIESAYKRWMESQT